MVPLGKSGFSGFTPVGAQECWILKSPLTYPTLPTPPSVGLWEEQAGSADDHPAGFPADRLDPAGPTLEKLNALG